MIKKLRRRLALAYTLSIGFLFTVFLFATQIANEANLRKGSLDLYQKNVVSIVNELQTKTAISFTYLAQTEFSNRYILHIEENGKPFLFPGSWNPPTPRQELVAMVKTLAKKQEIAPDRYPISGETISSEIFTITGFQKERYTATVSILPTVRGWKTIVLLQYVPDDAFQMARQRLFLAAADLISILLLFGINWHFIGKALQPVEESRKKQTEFIAAASHELRSPLSVVQASASAILQNPAKTNHFVTGIHRECTRMARLIEDLLLLASADAKTWTVRKEEIDLDTLLIDLYEAFLPLCQQKKQTLLLTLPNDILPVFMGDRERLYQCIAVLLDNASYYTPVGGQITLSAQNKKQEVIIAVSDNGPGISDEDKKKVFDRFYRTDKSRKEKTHYGLGLSIAKELVRLHSGSITLSDAPKGGAAFSVHLPVELRHPRKCQSL